MKMNYLDALDVMITTHQREAERHLEEVGRLTIAREVLMQLREAEGRPDLLLKANPVAASGPHTQTPGEQITIRSIYPVGEQKSILAGRSKKKPAKRKRDVEAGQTWRDRVMEVLAESPLKTPDVLTKLGMANKSTDERQSIYAAMSYLKTTGKVTRGKDGTYAIVKEEVAA